MVDVKLGKEKKKKEKSVRRQFRTLGKKGAGRVARSEKKAQHIILSGEREKGKEHNPIYFTIQYNSSGTAAPISKPRKKKNAALWFADNGQKKEGKEIL